MIKTVKPAPPHKKPIVKQFNAWSKLKFKLHFNKKYRRGIKNETYGGLL